MKKTIIAMAVAILGISAATAQEPAQGLKAGPNTCVLPAAPCKNDTCNDAHASCDARKHAARPHKDLAGRGNKARELARKHMLNEKAGAPVKGKPARRPGPASLTDRFQGVDLTPQQQAEINRLSDEMQADLAKQQDKFNQNRDKINNNYDKKLKKILTPEQYNQYKANENDRPVVRRKNGPIGKPQRMTPPMRMTEGK